MSDQVLRYDQMVENALRSVARDAMAIAAEKGMPGGHHFYLTFETGAAGVEIPGFLAAKYPEQMTIVIQHQYENFLVDDESFEVTLRFSGQPCRLHIPFAALTAFVDPSVKFGLQFKVETALANQESKDAETPSAKPPGEPVVEQTAEVVTLDSFRKKL